MQWRFIRGASFRMPWARQRVFLGESTLIYDSGRAVAIWGRFKPKRGAVDVGHNRKSQGWGIWRYNLHNEYPSYTYTGECMPMTSSPPISFSVDTDLRQKLMAFAYLRGNGGMYAAVARHMLHEAVRKAELEMDERAAADYKEILKNVQIREALEADNKKAPAKK
jgi:hypothetical protein